MKTAKFLLPAALLAALCGCMIHVPGPSAMETAPAAEAADAAAPAGMTANGADFMKAKAGHFTAPQGRKMAFTAQLILNVEDIREALSLARSLTIRNGGFIRRMNDQSLTVAIPVEKAESTLQELGNLGVVLSFQTEGEDVTRQIMDTEIRLENLRQSRKRLLALLEQAGKVDEMVKVEREITRVTTELEQLQTAQKNLNNRVQYVTMTVRFQTAAPRPVQKPKAPVAWVNRLGEDLLDLNLTANLEDDSAFLFDLELPSGFIKSGEAMAISADCCIIALQDEPNAVIAPHWYGDDYAPVSFYRSMIEKALEQRFGSPVEVKECTIDGEEALVFTVTPVIGKVQYTFRAAVAVKEERVKLLEIRARSEVFQKTMTDEVWNKLLDSVQF